MDVDEWMPGRSSARGLLYKVYRSPECFVAWHAGAQVCHPTLGGVGVAMGTGYRCTLVSKTSGPCKTPAEWRAGG